MHLTSNHPLLRSLQLEAARAEQGPLAEALQQLEAEKAALEERLAQAEADGASLRRMVRMLKYGDSAAPSPAPPSLTGGSEGGAGSAARARSRTGRQATAAGTPARLAGWQQDEDEEADGEQQAHAVHSDSGSSDEAEARQAQQSRGTVKRGGGGSGGSPSLRFLEEQVQSLTAALRRLQRQNRELSAQLEAAGTATGPAVAGALVPAADGQLAVLGQAPAAVSALQQEVTSLAAENATLRRQLAEAEEEAGQAQWAMHQQQAEARALHSQVVEVRYSGSVVRMWHASATVWLCYMAAHGLRGGAPAKPGCLPSTPAARFGL